MPFAPRHVRPSFASSGRSFLVAIAVMLVAFSLMRLSPGDPVVGPPRRERDRPEHRAPCATQLGLNGTYPEQLVDYVAGLASGDLGKSVVFGVR